MWVTRRCVTCSSTQIPSRLPARLIWTAPPRLTAAHDSRTAETGTALRRQDGPEQSQARGTWRCLRLGSASRVSAKPLDVRPLVDVCVPGASLLSSSRPLRAQTRPHDALTRPSPPTARPPCVCVCVCVTIRSVFTHWYRSRSPVSTWGRQDTIQSPDRQTPA